MRQSRAPPARAAVRSVAYGQLLGGAVSGTVPCLADLVPYLSDVVAL